MAPPTPAQPTPGRCSRHPNPRPLQTPPTQHALRQLSPALLKQQCRNVQERAAQHGTAPTLPTPFPTSNDWTAITGPAHHRRPHGLSGDSPTSCRTGPMPQTCRGSLSPRPERLRNFTLRRPGTRTKQVVRPVEASAQVQQQPGRLRACRIGTHHRDKMLRDNKHAASCWHEEDDWHRCCRQQQPNTLRKTWSGAHLPAPTTPHSHCRPHPHTQTFSGAP